jgi:acyl transferase domain-containing protein
MITVSKIDTALTTLQQEVNNCEKAVIELIQMKKKRLEKSMDDINKLNFQLQKSPIAIIGIASIFPQSRNVQEFWEKILNKVDCITDVPPSRWDVGAYYDPDPKAPDKTYCKRGGFIPDVDFNPMEFGLPPNILEVTDISQLLGLVVAKEALEDAGYGQSRKFNRERTGVILGVAQGRQLSSPLSNRLEYPIWEKVLKSSGLSNEDTQKIVEKIKLAYVNWEENAFPGMLANVVSGRIANRLDLGGMNCVVDAACASSLGALRMAISELSEHRSDMMLTGGVDTDNSIFAYICFSKTPAISVTQNTRPFDDDADGMMLGEGIGMMVLKRLEDAQRDQDRIYAVIRGIGSSSDGRYKSIYAPSPEGQIKALRRAYEDAGFSPATVSLVEGHGTGTKAGDAAEFAALKEFFSENNSRRQHIALGSVKSQIGHTKAAAGTASLIKTALALHHKVLPPTINITKPNSKFNIETSPFYLNTNTRPWIRTQGEAPRRAGVSSFGFGGTNYHVVMEEYESEHNFAYRLHNAPQSIIVSASTPEQLLDRCKDILQKLQSSTKDKYYVELAESSKSLEIPVTDARVGLVADSLLEAGNLLQIFIDWLQKWEKSESWHQPQGIYYRKTGIAPLGKIVALFSGQGSQYLDMGREIAINFPCLRQAYGYMNSLLLKDGLQPLSEIVFPPPVFDTAPRHIQSEVLQRTEYAQPAIGVFSVGLYKILQQAGFKPDFVAGHSFGELTALWAAEVLSDEDYFFLVKARGQAMAIINEPNFDAGVMLAVKGDPKKVEQVVKKFPQVTIANLNSKNQLVLAGVKSEIAQVRQILHEQGYTAVLLSVSAAFHTPLVSRAQKPFAQAIEAVNFRNAKIPVYSNVTGKPYPNQPQAVKNILKEHLINLVKFQSEIENIYADGGYFFIEFGPRNILTNLVKDILGEKPHLAVALNATRQKDSDRQLREAVMQLRVAGLHLKSLDPYQKPQETPDNEPNKLLNVRLNSSNYVTEKTKMAFEKALQDGHQVKSSANTTTAKTVTNPIQPPSEPNTTQTTQNQAISAKTVTNPIQPPSELNAAQPTQNQAVSVSSQLAFESNGHQYKNGQQVKYSAKTSEMETVAISMLSKSNTVATTQAPTALVSVQPALEPKMQTPNLNYQIILASLEFNLKQFNQHQDQILHVHEQFLNHQMEYGKTFCQLMEQRNLLFGNDTPVQQNLQAKLSVLESFERSMKEFQAYQDETLRIHEEYLKHQREYSKSFCQLIQQQYNLLLNDDVTAHQMVLTEAEDNLLTERKTDKLDSPDLFSDSPIVLPSNGHANSNGSNGSSHGFNLAEETIVEIPSKNGSSSSWESSSTCVIQPESIPTVPPLVDQNIDFAELSQTLLDIVSEKTGYPVQMLELDMDMEADLGIDSIKRVEILGALQELFPNLPKANPEEVGQIRTLGQIVEYIKTLSPETDQAQPQSVMPSPTVELDQQQSSYVANLDSTTSNQSESVEEIVAVDEDAQLTTIVSPTTVTIDSGELGQTLLNIVSEKTGYPVQMLELDMDMEADLGIDSIKRVEILGALQELFPNLPKANPEEVGQIRTLGQIVEYLQQQVNLAEKKKLKVELYSSSSV